jgi:ankyrin repeat protein
LVRYKANVNALGESDRTPLHDAAEHAKAEIARFLLRKGADVNAQNEGGETPLHCAVRSRDAETVSVLLQYKANAAAVNNDNDTPLDLAHKHAAAAIANMLKDVHDHPEKYPKPKPVISRYAKAKAALEGERDKLAGRFKGI